MHCVPTSLFFCSRCRAPRDLHSFPTRRSSDLPDYRPSGGLQARALVDLLAGPRYAGTVTVSAPRARGALTVTDRKSTRLNSSHVRTSYAVFCLKKKKQTQTTCSVLTKVHITTY